MCGLAGFVDRTGSMTTVEITSAVKKMTDRIAHRGPDDEGSWVDGESGVALGHRRLAIIDLSSEGHQPMQSASGAFVMVFNGEIYNFADIRAALEQHGYTFRGHSDTEVMLAAFEQWGVRAAVDRFNGMFSFAVWDRSARVLHLCRDRLGKKPMYYGWTGRTLLFGSELKCFHAHAAFKPVIDRNVLALYLRHGYIPAPYSIYEGIFKLPAGGLLTIGSSDSGGNRPPEVYWSVLDAARRSIACRIENEHEALERLELLLRDAVKIRMFADVPVGAFLSGGIDSSLVVALMGENSSIPVRSFSIGFLESSHNEAEHAKAVAEHLGCVHTEFYVTPAEAREVIPLLPHIYDEPFADASMIPTFLVSKLTRQSVTVALSGDGGDELFGGYTAYDSCAPYFARNRRWPSLLRRIAAAGILKAQPQALDRLVRLTGVPDAGSRLRRAASVLAHDRTGTAYQAMVSQWEDPGWIVKGGLEPPVAFSDPTYSAVAGDDVASMMLLDAAVYLPDDILTKVDRASMAVSLETRCPLLDYRLFEYAWRMPMELRRRNGIGKWPLKQLAYKLIPQTLLDRPKTGFAIPIAEWLRGPLLEWGSDLLHCGRLRQEGLLDPAPVDRAWRSHVAGQADNSARIWNILMFEAWLQHQSTAEPVQSSCASYRSYRG